MPPEEPETESSDDDRDEDDNDPHLLARRALLKPKLQPSHLDAFALLKRLHNESFPPHPTWAEAILSFKNNPIAVLSQPSATKDTKNLQPKWPLFLLFPCPRLPNKKGFDIDLARRILRDDQMGFRLGYAVEVLSCALRGIRKQDPIQWKQLKKKKRSVKEIHKFLTLFHYLILGRDDWEGSREGASERICSAILHSEFGRDREPEVKSFWDKGKRDGSLPEEGVEGIGKSDEVVPEWWDREGFKYRVMGTPFDRGWRRAAMESFTRSECKTFVEIEFDVDAWQKPVPETVRKERLWQDIDRDMRKHGCEDARIETKLRVYFGEDCGLVEEEVERRMKEWYEARGFGPEGVPASG